MTNPDASPVPTARRDRLRQLRAFCETARYGSITLAARKLLLSQPSVSVQVRTLEEELGVRLFERRGPRVALTQVGESLYRISMPLVQGLLRLPESFAERYHSADPGWLSIGAGEISAAYLLPDLLERFRARYPGVRIEVRTGSGLARLDWLRNFEVDIVVAAFDIVPHDIEFKPFRSSEFVLATPEDHPLAERGSVTLQSVLRYPLVAPVSGHHARQALDVLLHLRGGNSHIALEVEGWGAMLNHVAAGVGIAFVPDVAIPESERVRKISLRPRTAHRVYGMATLRDGHMPLAASWLVENLESTLPDLVDAT